MFVVRCDFCGFTCEDRCYFTHCSSYRCHEHHSNAPVEHATGQTRQDRFDRANLQVTLQAFPGSFLFFLPLEFCMEGMTITIRAQMAVSLGGFGPPVERQGVSIETAVGNTFDIWLPARSSSDQIVRPPHRQPFDWMNIQDIVMGGQATRPFPRRT